MQVAHDYNELSFSVGEWVNYPAHGIGCLKGIESLEYEGKKLSFLRIEFQNPFLLLRVPVEKACKNGLRKLSSASDVRKALKTLQSHPKAMKGLWIHRAQVYEKKVSSGSLMEICEVIRDLKEGYTSRNLSYSEMQLIESAIQRIAREVSVAEKIDIKIAEKKVTMAIQKCQRTA